MKKKQKAKKVVGSTASQKVAGPIKKTKTKKPKLITLSELIKKQGGPLAVARRLDVSLRTVNHWMSGTYFPRPNQLVNLFVISRGLLDIQAAFNSYIRMQVRLVEARGQAFKITPPKRAKKAAKKQKNVKKSRK